MGPVRRLLPAILLIAAAGGLAYVGWRAVRSEAAVAERTARAALEARARVGASTLDAAARDLLVQTRDQEAADRLDADQQFVRPEAPAPMPALVATTTLDPEGAFYLDGAARAERDGLIPEARQLYAAAAGPDRTRVIQALAGFRLGALIGRTGEAEADRVATIARGLTVLEGDDLATRDALVARVVVRSADDSGLPADLLRCVGGPDDAIARGLLRDLHPGAQGMLSIRDSELDRMAWLRARQSRTLAAASGALLDDGHLMAWRRDAAGVLWLARAAAPTFETGVTLAAHHDPDVLAVDVAVPTLPGIRLAATTPLSEVQAEATRRAITLAVALALLVAGALTALLMTWRAARRHAAAARDQAAFLAQVGHDLRTPVANIRLYAETLASGRVGDPEEAQEFAGVAAREAVRVSSMVEKVLELSRLDEGTGSVREVVDLGRLIDDVVTAHRPLLDDAAMRVEVESGAAEGPCVVGQSDALRGALGNLVENALAHARDGHTLEIRACRQRDDVAVTVSDRGPGLPAELGSRVFERFVRGPRVTSRGCGLGLALVREVARAHGGDADAKNRDGGGTEITLTLPGVET